MSHPRSATGLKSGRGGCIGSLAAVATISLLPGNALSTVKLLSDEALKAALHDRYLEQFGERIGSSAPMVRVMDAPRATLLCRSGKWSTTGGRTPKAGRYTIRNSTVCLIDTLGRKSCFQLTRLPSGTFGKYVLDEKRKLRDAGVFRTYRLPNQISC